MPKNVIAPYYNPSYTPEFFKLGFIMKTKILLIFAFVLSGCAIPKAVDFSQTTAPKPSTLEVSSNEQIKASININYAVANQFGLLGAVVQASIDARRQTKANNDSVQIVEHIQPYNIGEAFTSQLQNYLDDSRFFAGVRVQNVTPEENTEPKDLAPGASQIFASYFLTDNFCCLNIKLRYAVRDNEADSKPIIRHYNYAAPIASGSDETTSRDDNTALILNTDQPALAAMIDNGIKELITVMDRDLNGNLPLLQGDENSSNEIEVTDTVSIARTVGTKGIATISITPVKN